MEGSEEVRMREWEVRVMGGGGGGGARVMGEES